VIQACGISDTGRVRKTNEDKFISDPEFRLFAVADGMGGHSAGEVASRLAIETVTGFIRRSANGTEFSWPYGLDKTLSFDGNRLRTAVHLANRKVFRTAESSDDYDGMGTTFVGMLVNDGRVSVAHVGDSRVYLWRDGRLSQITEDHSWVGEQVRAGVLSDADARRHPWRNVVTRALAGGDDPQVEVSDIEVKTGDRILLCSDGLSGVVAPEKLETIVGQSSSLQDTCQALIDAANAAGGPDNITVAMLKVDVA